MNARMFVITASAVVALAAPAAQSASALTSGDGGNTRPAPATQRVVHSGANQPATTHRGNFGARAATRASRLLHNPGLPAWIP